jgi:hypothetical protein
VQATQPAYAQPAYPQTTYARAAYPQTAYPQTTYPQTTYARAAYPQTAYPQAYMQPATAAGAYLSSAPMPAAYAYAGYPNDGAQYQRTAAYYGHGYAPTGSWSPPRAEAPVPMVETKDKLHYVQMGMGGFIPTDGGNPAKLGLEANIWALRGGWVPNSGLYLTLDASTGFDVGCKAKSADEGCKGHFRIHWIGGGPFFNTGRPMIVSDVQRSWDLMAFTGAEVRLWKGMTVKTTVNWFLASPWGVYAHHQRQAEASLNGTATSAPASPGAASTIAQSLDPAAAVENVLGHALRHPQINLMALWEF